MHWLSLHPGCVEMDETGKQFFDKRRVRSAFDKAADSYDAAAVLQKEVCNRLLDRLDYVKLSPTRILDAGAGTGEAIIPLHKRYENSAIVTLDISEKMLLKTAGNVPPSVRSTQVCGDIESLPFSDQCFDLVFSNLTLQWCNDVQAALAEFNRVLKPDGLLMFTIFGPDTLKELRASWMQVDQSVHVNAFYDMHDLGDSLQYCKFAGPVMEAEHITVTYKDVDTLMDDLRSIGANVTASGHRQGLLTRNMVSKLRTAYDRFRKQGVLPATYEVIYGHAWRPVQGTPDRESTGSIRVDFNPE